MTIEVSRLDLPARADEAGERGDALRALTAFVNRVRSAQFGTDAVAVATAEQRGLLADRAESRQLCFLAWLDGRIVGRAVLGLPLLESLTMVEASWCTDPDLDPGTAHDVAAALLQEVEAVSVAEGRPWLLVEVPVHDGDHLAASGVGAVDANAPDAAVLLAAGFTVQQCYRWQLLRLEVDPASLAATSPDDGYRIATWTGRVPTPWREDFCALASLMQTEVPAAEVEFEEALWDEARLVGYEELLERAGRTLVGAIAWDADGQPAGYTELMVSASPLARQGDTLVAPAHRGHALGARLKVANLSRLGGDFSHVTLVVTENAEENSSMLAVNERLGFLSAHREALFQRRGASRSVF